MIKILLGVALLFLALRQWRSRPKPGEEPALPKWMAAIDTMTAGAAFGARVPALGGEPEEPAHGGRRRRDHRHRPA